MLMDLRVDCAGGLCGWIVRTESDLLSVVYRDLSVGCRVQGSGIWMMDSLIDCVYRLRPIACGMLGLG